MTPSHKSVTRNDVARLAGVSTATVSYVLNGSKRVSPATEERVREASAMLGFRPNRAARALRLGSPEMLGIVVPDASNLFFSDLAHQVELVAEEHGLEALVANANGSAARERLLVEKFVARRVDGMLLGSTLAVSELRALVPREIPFVLLNTYDVIPDVPTVGVDLYEGARLAVQHLADHGHPAVGLISGATAPGIIDAREKGWRETIEGRGLMLGPAVHEPFTSAGGYAAARRLIETRTLPPALFVASDELAMGVLLAFHEAGVRVPDDVAIVSFDDTRAAEFTWPPLTTIAQPTQPMARAAVTVLLDAAAGPSRQLFAPSLVKRVSCGCSRDGVRVDQKTAVARY